MKPNPARFGVWARILLLLLGGAAASLASGTRPGRPRRWTRSAERRKRARWWPSCWR